VASTYGFDLSDFETVFDDLVRCETRLYNAVSERLRVDHDMSLAHLEFLQFLHDHPTARVADLARHFAVGVGATSKGVDRMEAAGWVRRLPNPEDRRSSLLELTIDGQRLVESARPTGAMLLHELVTRGIEGAEFLALGPTLRSLRSVLERDGVGTPAG